LLLHGGMFELMKHELGVIFYCGIALTKILVLIFFFIPWVALRLAMQVRAPSYSVGRR
jgi:hypothetical protein